MKSRIVMAAMGLLGLTLALGMWRGMGTQEVPPREAPVRVASPLGLVPWPAQVTPGQGVFRLTSSTPIVCDSGLLPQARQLSRLLGLPLVTRPVAVPHIELRLRAPGLGKEGYRLQVTEKSIVISAATPQGIFYGMQTLRQLLSGEVGAVTIVDEPRFAWRGAHLDVSRHFMPVEFVKKFVDLLARHKFNRFHWHLTDDQGWRLEIGRYPRLTTVGAWRKSVDASDSKPYGGFYSRREVEEIVAYAAERFVTVIPEVEMPGHAQAAVAAYPQLGCTGTAVEVGNTWGISPHILNADASTVAFMQNVLEEVLQMFPSPWIHIGGDEAVKTQWKGNPRIQDRIRALHLKDEAQLQSWFIGQMDGFLTSRGRRLVGWDEILEGGLAPHATVMNWHEFDRAWRALRSGNDVVLTPASQTYFDYYQSRDVMHEPLAVAGYTPLEQVYGWEPLPRDFPADLRGRVLGVQGQLWSEFLEDSRQVEYMAFPRLLALAEVAWGGKGGRSFGDFRASLEVHLRTLKDVNFRALDP